MKKYMARFYRKKWFISLTVLLIGFLILFVALPVVGSMRLVDSQLTTALERLTGHRVTFNGQPKIGVFPRLHVEINMLTLTPKADNMETPIFQAERVRLDLSAWSVINGEILVQNTKLIRPILTIPNRDESTYIERLVAGDLYRGLRTAHILTKQSPLDADLSSIRPFKIGPVTIESGAIEFMKDGDATSDRQKLSSINGTFIAREMNSAANLDLSAIWQGENISFNGDAENLLSLLVGGFSDVEFTFDSAPVSLTFLGNVSLAAQSFAEGKTTISSPSLSSFLAWVDKDTAITDRIGAIDINANMRARGAQFYLDQAEVNIEDTIGTGSMEINFQDSVPAINATLAFDTLNLKQILTSLSHNDVRNGINLSISDDVTLDLRLSANTAMFTPFELQNIAASLQIKPDLRCHRC